jgi:flagellin
MSLMINQNITSLNAWRNLNKTDRSMSATMEKLSSGLRINRAADDPSGLVTSEQMRAQVVGLKAAIKNSEKGISMIQTAEAALDKVHGLLDKLRGLALDSANVAANDDNMLAANQAEVTNILDTITRISTNTQYGTKKLLDGTNSIVGVLDTAGGGVTGMNSIQLASGQSPATLSVTIRETFTPGTPATPDPDSATLTEGTGAVLVDAGDLDVGDYTLTVNGRFEHATMVDTALSDGTDSITVGLSSIAWTGSAARNGTWTVAITGGTLEAGVGGLLDVNLTPAGGGGPIATQLSVDGNGDAELVGDLGDDLFEFHFSGFTGDFDGTLSAGTEDYQFSFSVTASTATVTFDGETEELNSLDSDLLGDYAIGGATFDLSGVGYQGGVNNLTATLTVPEAEPATPDTYTYTAALGAGTEVNVTSNSSVTLTDENGNRAAVTLGTLTDGTATFEVTDNALVFQIGANQNQTVKIGIQNVAASQLAVGVAQSHNSGFASLAQIDVTDAAKATDSLALIDAAIDQISVIRGNLGAFQANTLEANLDSLRVAAENLQASESVVRDADMAAEMAEFTKYQIMLQAGTAMLAQANQIPNNILQLLR